VRPPTPPPPPHTSLCLPRVSWLVSPLPKGHLGPLCVFPYFFHSGPVYRSWSLMTRLRFLFFFFFFYVPPFSLRKLYWSNLSPPPPLFFSSSRGGSFLSPELAFQSTRNSPRNLSFPTDSLFLFAVVYLTFLFHLVLLGLIAVALRCRWLLASPSVLELGLFLTSVFSPLPRYDAFCRLSSPLAGFTNILVSAASS